MMRRIVHTFTFVLFVVGLIQLAIMVQLYVFPSAKQAIPLKKEAVLPVHNEAESKVEVKQPAKAFTLPQSQFVAQSFNNCGPATLSMILFYYGKNVSQEEIATQMRPFNNPFGGIDDKSIFASEFALHAKQYGFVSFHRPNGTIDLLKTFVANDIPVVVRTWLNPYEDIGHFRIVRGYDEEREVIIVDDSYNGPNLEVSYADFLSMWQPFNYSYILVFPKEKQDIVSAVLGEEKDEEVAFRNARKRSEEKLQENPDNAYAQFNIAIAEYYLGNYEEAVIAFEKAEFGLPPRMLWYQYEPILAYQKVKNYDRVFQLTDTILINGNLAFSELYQIRGEVYEVLGNKEAAKQAFENAVYYNHNFLAAKKALENIN